MNQGFAEKVTCSLSAGTTSPYIKELKKRLGHLIEKKEGSHVEYVEGATGDALYKDKDVAVQMMYLPAGSQFPEHVHPAEKEWIIIIKGSAEVTIEGTAHLFNAQDHFVVEPGQDHSGYAIDDLWHIAISIPADDGYPDVGN